ncbi:MAG: guanylate kinase [Thermodesulfobacteriota bacterium]
MSTGQLFIISAPSGAGKTTILKEVMKDLPALSFSVSHTTRPPRDGEVDGQDYHFISKNDFLKMRDAGDFLEWAEVHTNLYGTSLKAVQDQLQQGTDVILDIDVQGASQLRDAKEVQPVTIFIAPPTIAELQRRLTGRATDNEETVRLRIENAVREMDSIDLYDHLIVNDKLAEAIEMVKAVILAERSRAGKNLSGSLILPLKG